MTILDLRVPQNEEVLKFLECYPHSGISWSVCNNILFFDYVLPGSNLILGVDISTEKELSLHRSIAKVFLKKGISMEPSKIHIDEVNELVEYNGSFYSIFLYEAQLTIDGITYTLTKAIL
jgi:hypothetical protein